MFWLLLILLVVAVLVGMRLSGPGVSGVMGMLATEGVRRLVLVGLAGLAALMLVRYGLQYLHVLGGVAAAAALWFLKTGPFLLRWWARLRMMRRGWRTLRARMAGGTAGRAAVQFEQNAAGRLLDGRIVEGPWRDRSLSDLSSHEITAFQAWLERNDRVSARTFAIWCATWREKGQERGGDSGHRAYGSADSGDPGERAAGGDRRTGSRSHKELFDVEQACQVLGVGPRASRTEIRAAYVERMRQCHPDRGGNPREAALVNAARDLLLDGG